MQIFVPDGKRKEKSMNSLIIVIINVHFQCLQPDTKIWNTSENLIGLQSHTNVIACMENVIGE